MLDPYGGANRFGRHRVLTTLFLENIGHRKRYGVGHVASWIAFEGPARRRLPITRLRSWTRAYACGKSWMFRRDQLVRAECPLRRFRYVYQSRGEVVHCFGRARCTGCLAPDITKGATGISLKLEQMCAWFLRRRRLVKPAQCGRESKPDASSGIPPLQTAKARDTFPASMSLRLMVRI
jgi:hypothetical protein